MPLNPENLRVGTCVGGGCRADDPACMRAAFLAGASFVLDETRVNDDYQLLGEPDWSTIEAAAAAYVTYQDPQRVPADPGDDAR